MKKILLTILIISLCSFSLLAAEEMSGGIYDSAAVAYRPTSLRQLGMGGANVASARGTDSLYINPASLAKGGFKIAVPTLGVTFYNIKDIINPENTLIKNVTDGDFVNAAIDYLNIVSKFGKNRIADIDAGVTLQAGPIALGVNAQAIFHSLSKGSISSTEILPEVNAAATVGLGFRIPLGFMSIDIGANASFAYKLYTKNISAGTLMPMLSDMEQLMDKIMSETPVAAGYAIPISAGVNVNLPLGFKASAVARNINGTYNMIVYPGAATWADQTIKTDIGGTVKPFDPETAQKVEIKVPFSLDAGVSWKWKNGFLSPEVSAELRDVLNVDFEQEGAWLKNLNVGANIRLLSILDVSAGLNQGYISAGVGIDLWAVHVEAAYAFREFGTIIGEKGVDSLSIKAVLGYDR